MFNRTYAAYDVGEKWVSRSRTVTEADIAKFAEVSGDFYPLHMDDEYAKGTDFGQRVAHGMLILSMATGLMEFTPGKVLALYGMDRLRFTAPTFIGDTIHVELEVSGKERKRTGGMLLLKLEVKKQEGDTVIAGTLNMLVQMLDEAELE